MKKATTHFLCLLLLVFGLCHSSYAATSSAPGKQQPLLLGLGAVFSDNPYRGVNSEFLPLPFLSYEGERFFVRGITAGYHLFKQEDLTISMLGSYRMAGYESGDSAFLQGMADRDGTLEAGLQATLATSLGRFHGTVLSDILDEHNGQEAKLTFSKRLPLQNFSVSPFVSLIWQTGQLTDYYYGVRAAEATLARPAYEVDSSILMQVGLMANYMFDQHWAINGRIAVTRLSDEISDSPIVEDDLVPGAFIGIGYRF
jgi:outer membrane protein